MQRRIFVWLFGAGLLVGAVFPAEAQTPPGTNPNPVRLIRRPTEPLSFMARLGRDIFFDASLSSSGKVSCASCHSPDHAYGPPNDGPVMLGGPDLTLPGARAVPSLTYLERQLGFSIGPDKDDGNENGQTVAQQADLAKTADRRILCSAAAVDRADDAERAHWAECYSTVLRGRSEATHVSAPAGSISPD